MLVFKLVTIAEHIQAPKAQGVNYVTHMLWNISLQLMLSIRQHFRSCLSMSKAQNTSGDTPCDVCKPHAAVQHCAQLLLELLAKAANQMLHERGLTTGPQAQACLNMMHLLLSDTESLCQGSATASKLISWGTVLTSVKQRCCKANALNTFKPIKHCIGACKSCFVSAANAILLMALTYCCSGAKHAFSAGCVQSIGSALHKDRQTC